MAETPRLPISSPEEPEATKTPSAERQRVEAIQANLLKALGRPARLFRVSVTPLWSNHFRVNILIGDDATGVTIPNSYFLTADDRGTILGATPPVQRLY